MWPVRIHLILDTEKKASALKVLSALQAEFGFRAGELEPYHKGGMQAHMQTVVLGPSWSERVVQVIRFAQSLAFGWHLSGNIIDEIELVTNGTRIPGVSWIHVSASRHDDRAADEKIE